MPLTCPNCDGKRPRLSKVQGFRERVLDVLGTYPVRCEECGHRFYDSVYRLTNLLFARCPKCYRMDLSTWQLQNYSPSRWTLIQLWLGGRRVRCEACRLNFASFRLTKETSTFRDQYTGYVKGRRTSPGKLAFRARPMPAPLPEIHVPHQWVGRGGTETVSRGFGDLQSL